MLSDCYAIPPPHRRTYPLDPPKPYDWYYGFWSNCICFSAIIFASLYAGKVCITDDVALAVPGMIFTVIMAPVFP